MGCMQWMRLGTVRAEGDLDAVRKWRKSKKGK